MGIIGVISVWFVPLLRRENRTSKIVVFFASEEAILLTNNKTCFYCQRRRHHHRSLCPKKFTEHESVHFVDKETQSVMEDNQTIKAKRKVQLEAFRNVKEELLANKQGKPTNEKNERVQEPSNSLNSELFSKTVKDIEPLADESCELGKISKEQVHNKSSKEYAELESKCTELNNKMSGMTEEIRTLKSENQDLAARLKDISISMANTYRMPQKELMS